MAVLTGFLPIDALLHLTNIGTLFAFLIVCAAVLIMRRTNPDAERPFRAPFYPFVPILGILSCLMLMFSLPVENWWRLLAWMALGFIIYFSYGYKHSELRKRTRRRGAEVAARLTVAAGASTRDPVQASRRVIEPIHDAPGG